MASDDDYEGESPWTRPGFVSASLVVAIVVVLGLIVGAVSLIDGDRTAASTREPTAPPPTAGTPETTPPTPDPSGSPTASASPAQPSVCGLTDDADADAPETAPDATWTYEGALSYPTSPVYGPGAVDSSGFRYCFQRSPSGALFAAANAVAQGSNPAGIESWLNYFVASGPHREQAIQTAVAGAEDSSGTRMRIAGYRILAATPDAVTVDIAIVGTGESETVFVSAIYNLVWEDGDWKLAVSDPDNPVDIASIPDLYGYTDWGD